VKHMNSSSCNAAKVICLGLARTIYIRCIYGIFGREITKFTVIYGAYIRSWPTLEMSLYHSALYLCFSAVSPSSYFLGPPPTASHNAYGKELLLSWHLDTFDLGTYVHHRHFCIVKNYYAEAIAFSHYRVCFVKSRGEKKDGLYVPKHSPFSHYRVCFIKSRGEKKDGLYVPKHSPFSHYRVCFIKSRGEKKDGLYVPKHSPFSHYRVCFVKSRGEKKDGLYMPGVDLRAKVTLLAEGARGSITQVGVGVGSCWEGRGGHVI